MMETAAFHGLDDDAVLRRRRGDHLERLDRRRPAAFPSPPLELSGHLRRHHTHDEGRRIRGELATGGRVGFLRPLMAAVFRQDGNHGIPYGTRFVDFDD
jgi:hypothetical protein